MWIPAWSAQLQFQSTLPRGERQPGYRKHKEGTYFNPRSREGSDESEVVAIAANPKISIHAPARGATSRMERHGRNQQISIHAPARGATQATPRCTCSPRFQSTLPRGERPLLAAGQLLQQYFNPRSREGSDGGSRNKAEAVKLFQSTLPRGERLGNAGICRTTA